MNFFERTKNWKRNWNEKKNQHEKDPSKSVIVVDKKGQFQTYSTEELMSKKLNNFEGWLCAAGTESLHISHYGLVQLAACNINGIQGNIYKDDIQLPKDWVRCTKKSCMCGGDMQIRKAKDKSWQTYAEDAHKMRLKPTNNMREPTWVGPYHFPVAEEQFNTVSWDIGKRCNYSCSYCPPQVSSRTDPLQTWDNLMLATNKVLKMYGPDKKIKWVITGGEPTIIPDYLRWVDYVTDMGHIVHTTTNGSRGGKYMEQLIQKSCIGLSVHLEFMDVDRLVETCRRIVVQKCRDEKADRWWFGVRVMVPPTYLDKAMEIKERLYQIPFFEEKSHFFVSPIHHYSFTDKGSVLFGDLYDYTPEELKGIQELG